jgi:hypothetical protein
VASLGLILPGAGSIATWLTPLAGLSLAVVMVGAAAFYMSRKETLATAAAASLALIMIFLACGRTFVVPLHSMTNSKGPPVVVGGATSAEQVEYHAKRRRADSYFASTASSDNTLPRYNVNTFLNSATTRTFSLVSASS